MSRPDDMTFHLSGPTMHLIVCLLSELVALSLPHRLTFPLPSSTCRVSVCPFTGASEWRRRRRCSPCQRLPSVSLSSCSGFWVVAVGCGVVGEAASSRHGQREKMNHVVEEIGAAGAAGSTSYMFKYTEDPLQEKSRFRHIDKFIWLNLIKTCSCIGQRNTFSVWIQANQVTGNPFLVTETPSFCVCWEGWWAVIKNVLKHMDSVKFVQVSEEGHRNVKKINTRKKSGNKSTAAGTVKIPRQM